MNNNPFSVLVIIAIVVFVALRVVGGIVRAAIKAQGRRSPEDVVRIRAQLPPRLAAALDQSVARSASAQRIGRELPPRLAAALDQSVARSASAPQQETHMNAISFFIFLVFEVLAAATVALHGPLVVAAVFAIIGFLILFSLKMAQQWDKAVILRAGKLQSIKGPGLFFIVPIFDSITAWIDQRIRTSEFSAEQALTRDTVPVNVDAIVFWMVHDAERAALEIADYNSAVQRVAQTSLREMIGSSLLSDLLSERKEADATLKAVIGAKTAEWGVTVNSVEIRDVAIPANLQDAMSRQAQAEREKQARVTLGSAEEQIAQSFVNAAKLYAKSPEALQLRAMNIVYETTKERGATILMPSTMVDAMNPGIALALLNKLPSQPTTAVPQPESADDSQ